MACGPCEKRRQMIAAARKQAGAKGVLKVLPKVARDVVKNPPNIRKGRNG
jgi:hypothetical protein